MNIRKRLSVVVAHDKTRVLFLDRPRRGKSTRLGGIWSNQALRGVLIIGGIFLASAMDNISIVVLIMARARTPPLMTTAAGSGVLSRRSFTLLCPQHAKLRMTGTTPCTFSLTPSITLHLAF